MHTAGNPVEGQQRPEDSACDEDNLDKKGPLDLDREITTSDQKGHIRALYSTTDPYNESGHISYTEDEGREVKRKIDFRLLPLLCGCYIFSVRTQGVHCHETRANATPVPRQNST